jgi:hypothetical protein
VIKNVSAATMVLSVLLAGLLTALSGSCAKNRFPEREAQRITDTYGCGKKPTSRGARFSSAATQFPLHSMNMLFLTS